MFSPAPPFVITLGAGLHKKKLVRVRPISKGGGITKSITVIPTWKTREEQIGIFYDNAYGMITVINKKKRELSFLDKGEFLRPVCVTILYSKRVHALLTPITGYN